MGPHPHSQHPNFLPNPASLASLGWLHNRLTVVELLCKILAFYGEHTILRHALFMVIIQISNPSQRIVAKKHNGVADPWCTLLLVKVTNWKEHWGKWEVPTKKVILILCFPWISVFSPTNIFMHPFSNIGKNENVLAECIKVISLYPK